MPTPKLLTWEAVRAEAARQLYAHGSTTTLDVKEALRADGYWATQTDVSYLLANLAQFEGWAWRYNGHHRTYTLATASPLTVCVGFSWN